MVCAASLAIAAPIAGLLALDPDPYGEGHEILGDGIANNCGPPYVVSPYAAELRLRCAGARRCAIIGAIIWTEPAMGQVIVRKLDDEVIAAHKRRAKARGVSLEQQLRDVLAEAAKPSREELSPAAGGMPRADAARAAQAGRGSDPRGSRQPMTLVVDASVALKWFVDEDGSDRAVALLDGDEPLIAPDLVVAEVCNAAWKSLRRRRDR